MSAVRLLPGLQAILMHLPMVIKTESGGFTVV